jgi:uncharacterized phage-associated protein
MPTSLTKSELDRLGNTLLYLSINVGDFNKTKALKLLFLLEEKSIRETGIPFFGFNFKVWQYGPVIEEVFEDLDQIDIPLLSSYIQRIKADKDLFEPAAKFNDDEFSNNDILLMDEIVKFARHKSAADLVKITHAKDSLWRKAAEKNEVFEAFENRELTQTEFLIDFSILVENDEYLKERYQSSTEYLQFNHFIKS